ncbi:hypothetical protein DACRYDRAFT_103170 [Dacryopinax primogenitus]|uniref:Pkr1-domain-containing protein n=1 Tax=Dacryopinax primogenitus (strain DJM 731) TaxID=1858805 RepID=M5GCI3_DACPD|nr:uncharacterized protein DACRYDRAFT_103170 [Dacryopinax primogenitus]EJU06225.1 hypothetical protein DACRYDRAFT_103170 [Dacryopinax primogenitus]
MSTTTPENTANEPGDTTNDIVSFFADILTPGSSLRPQFLLALDVVLGFLLFIFLSLLCLTWSLHFLALMAIDIGLWASVKFFVAELARTEEPASSPHVEAEGGESKKDQ